MAKSKSSKQWLREHQMDVYGKQARDLGYRSRAVFKLLEIDKKDRLFRAGMTVVDLGASPGSWSILAGEKVGARGKVVAMDILPMEPIQNVEFIQGNFMEVVIFQKLIDLLKGKKVDLVLSDIAPNMSGNEVVDQAQIMNLSELAFEFSKCVLVKGGTFLVKVFHGEGFEEYLRLLRKYFKKVFIRKPEASRSRSSELYLLAKGFGIDVDGL